MLIKFSSAYFLFPRKLSIYFPLYFRAYRLIEPTNPAISALCYAPRRDNLGETAWSLVFLVSVVGREKTDPMFLTFAPNLFNRSCRSRGPSFACVQSLERCRNILWEITYGVMLRSKGEKGSLLDFFSFRSEWGYSRNEGSNDPLRGSFFFSLYYEIHSVDIDLIDSRRVN